LKQRFGYALYVVEAFRLWVTHKYPTFAACFKESGNETPRVEEASQILAVRIRNFGGVLHDLAPGAAITNPKLHVIALTTRSRVRYLRFMIAVLLGRHQYVAPIQLVECESVECYALEGATEELFVEADGEWLGTLPVRMEVVPDALTVLIPQKNG
jgi:diacylglycerol kinase family enzyme